MQRGLDCVEVNSSFYRRHRADTWRRWADSVPDDFRFAVKLPKDITHVCRLDGCDELIGEFFGDTRGLGAKFAVALVQLAPKHAFDASVARDFFAKLHSQGGASIVCEPRHPSWFGREADELLSEQGVARAAADPAVVPSAAGSGGSLQVRYWRLHGSPAIYRSAYEPEAIERYVATVRAAMHEAETWCIFDNTASSAATRNALDFKAAV